MQSFVNARHLNVHIRKKAYHTVDKERVVLKNISFTVERGRFLSILGPSGCGKTTLLRLIAGLDLNVDGVLSIYGKSINGPGPDRGLVFQERRVLGWRTVAGNIRFALPSLPRKEVARRLSHVLKMVGLDDVQNMWPHQLSGGMERRLAIARAVVSLPEMLLLDEPLAGLDPFVREAFLSLLEAICKNENMTGILVTHDVDDAIMISDEIIVLTATPARVAGTIKVDLPRPRRPTAREFMELRRDVLEEFLTVGK